MNECVGENPLPPAVGMEFESHISFLQLLCQRKVQREAHQPRPETRTGCPTMIKFRVMDSKRWRAVEFEIEHKVLISPASGKVYKSHKTTGLGIKRLQPDGAEEVQPVRLFRTVIIDHADDQNTKVGNGESENNTCRSC